MGTYITNIGLLATPRGHSARRGTQQGDVTLLRNAWVELHGETIAAVGQGTPAPAEGDRVIDAGGRLVTPGLVDAHTHLIFGGWRQNELGQKLRGVPYLDILAQGGGILSTVRATRAATEEQLAQKAADYMDCLTDGRYDELVLARDLSAKARSADDPTPRDTAYLSAGTADLLYLSVRLALCELTCPTDDPCPLVLDDTLVNFDDARAERARALFREIAQHRQVILFTCHERDCPAQA